MIVLRYANRYRKGKLLLTCCYSAVKSNRGNVQT